MSLSMLFLLPINFSTQLLLWKFHLSYRFYFSFNMPSITGLVETILPPCYSRKKNSEIKKKKFLLIIAELTTPELMFHKLCSKEKTLYDFSKPNKQNRVPGPTGLKNPMHILHPLEIHRAYLYTNSWEFCSEEMWLIWFNPVFPKLIWLKYPVHIH